MAPPPGKEEDLCHGPRRVCGRADSWTVRCRAFRGASQRPGPATHFPLAVMPLADSLALRGVRRPPFLHTWTLALASPAERAVFDLVFFSLSTALAG